MTVTHIQYIHTLLQAKPHSVPVFIDSQIDYVSNLIWQVPTHTHMHTHSWRGREPHIHKWEGIQFPGILLWVRLAFQFINLAYETQPGTHRASPYKEIITTPDTHKGTNTHVDVHTMDRHAERGRH